MAANLPIGCFVRIAKPGLQAIIDALKGLGYRVVGPTVSESAIAYADIESVSELPIGWTEEQEAGTYRLARNGADTYFAHVVGPHSLKNFLYPSRTTILESIRTDGTWTMQVPATTVKPLAVIGPRSCDLHALAMQDRIFLGDRFVNPEYAARREGLFVLAVQCERAAPTCFCNSLQRGPMATGGFDLALTELSDNFVIEVGSERGGEVVVAADWRPCTTQEVAAALKVPRDTEHAMNERVDAKTGARGGRRIDTAGLHDRLLENLEDPRWDEVGARCLACGNCTMVCPTCFCSNVREVADLTGDRVTRVQEWDTCYNDEHSYMNSGTVRKTTRARYRQWLTHKLASWIDQFGAPGCVGCGRCITWCPVGIDMTEEAAAIGGGAS
jgi:formate hydrogenlyase subunit 6/NADH:ubiquinone oxidoreductase subunit I